MPLRLENPSATCYINAALQLLLQIQVPSWPAEKPAGQLLNNLLTLRQTETGVVAAWKEVNKVVGRDHKFVGFQGDAHEMLLEIIRALENDAFINSIFGIGYIKTTQCAVCGHQSHREETPTQMDINNKARNLSDLFQGFFSPTLLENVYECSECTKRDSKLRTTAEIVQRIKVWPPYLMMHIMRFADDGTSKLSEPFKYSLVFRGSRPQDPEYELDGMILHVGSDWRSGHYKTVCRENHSWFFLLDDDRDPQRVPQSEVQNLGYQQQVYILLYRRRSRKN